MAELKHEVKPENISEEVGPYVPSLHIEVSKEQLEILEVGKDVIIQLKGKVKSLSAADYAESTNRYNIQLDLQEVTIDPKENEFSELADD